MSFISRVREFFQYFVKPTKPEGLGYILACFRWMFSKHLDQTLKRFVDLFKCLNTSVPFTQRRLRTVSQFTFTTTFGRSLFKLAIQLDQCSTGT